MSRFIFLVENGVGVKNDKYKAWYFFINFDPKLEKGGLSWRPSVTNDSLAAGSGHLYEYLSLNRIFTFLLLEWWWGSPYEKVKSKSENM